ncbi:MAG: glycosyltransferase family protein [Eubacteriales bacterium]|nr:glycosyltransferase family protein [Eubacteriales bacterium]
MRSACIIQARQGSSRLPNKATIDICGKPCLQRVIERCRASSVDDVIVATTTNKADDAIVELCTSLNCHYYRGSEENVLSRVLEAAKAYAVDVIVEITADCPLIDPNHINHLLQAYDMSQDLITNIKHREFPRGYDIRIFSTGTLERINKEVDNPIDRQHVSTWMYLNPKNKGKFKILHWTAPPGVNRPDVEVTLDTPEDLELIRFIYGFEGQGYNLSLTCAEVIGIIDTYPEMYKKVAEVKRKDYFEELQEYYDSVVKTTNESKQTNNNEVQNECSDNRSGQPRRRGRPPKQR